MAAAFSLILKQIRSKGSWISTKLLMAPDNMMALSFKSTQTKSKEGRCRQRGTLQARFGYSDLSFFFGGDFRLWACDFFFDQFPR